MGCLLILCAGAAMAQPAENLLTNGGFEAGLDAWRFGCLRSLPGNTYTRSNHASAGPDANARLEGAGSARFDSSLAYDESDPRAVLEQSVALDRGYYRLSVKYRLEAEPGEGFGLVHHDQNMTGGQSYRLDPSADSDEWRTFEAFFRLRTSDGWRVLLYLKGEGRLWYDDARVESVSMEEYMEASKLPRRDYHIDTALVEGGEPRATIVTSTRRPAYAGIAERVRAAVHALSGVSLAVVDAGEVSAEGVLAESNAIVLGNLVTSSFVERLYWEWHALLDLWYPGPGGHVARTLHNPYGTGRNVILLGGSDDDGVATAADAFCDRLEAGDPLTVGRLMDIRLGEGHEMPVDGEWVHPNLRIFRPDAAPQMGYTELSRLGLTYHYGGDEEVAKQFRERALGGNELIHADHYTAHMNGIVWDLIEESPVFSDADREAITQKLLEHAQGPDGSGGIGRLLSYSERPHLLDRHASMQAICTLIESRYFGKHWPSEEWERNLAAVRKYFDRQMTTGKGDSDLGGRGIYSYLECAIIPALLLGDQRFIDSGALRAYGELALMHCDNTGYMPDTGQSEHNSYPTYTLQKCAALLGDGGFLATAHLRERAERASGHSTITMEFTPGQTWATGIQPEPMEKMIGVYRLPLTEWEHEARGQAVPIEKSFDKLTMREGFGVDDQYLLLDGLHGGPPGKPYPDVNSIASFTQNGRIFLVSGIGGQNATNHNVVTVCRDGFGGTAGLVASLEATADLPSFGYSHSRAEDYYFSEWDRHILWRKGKWFVVLDRLKVTDDGEYSLECQWRTTGDPEIRGSDYAASVGDVADTGAPRDVLNVRNAERLPVRFSKQRMGIFGPPETDRWERYWAGDWVNRVRQLVQRDMRAGDEQLFTNLVYVGGDRTEAEYGLVSLGDGVSALTGDETAYVGVGGGPFERPGLRIRAEAFVASSDSIAIVNGIEVEVLGQRVLSSAPCNMELSLTDGAVTVEASIPVEVSVNDETTALDAGVHEMSMAPTPRKRRQALAKRIRTEADGATSRPPAMDAARPSEPLAATWQVDLGAEVTALAPGGAATDVVVGLADGRVVGLTGEGQVKWRFQAQDAVRALDTAALGGKAAVLVGSDDEHVYAVAESGEEIWRYRCALAPGHYSWWTTDLKAKVQTILAHDIDGDGLTEIICGTGGGCIETLDEEGQRRWLTRIDWGTPDRLAVVEMGDGSKTVLSQNSRNSSQSTTWRLQPDGAITASNALTNDRGGWDMTAAPSLMVADLNGDGSQEAVVGRSGAYNEIALYDAVSGERKWTHTLGDSADCLASVDGEVVVGSRSGWLCAFDLTGRQLWATQMPHEVITVQARGDGLFVACGDNGVYWVGKDGRVGGAYRLLGEPAWQSVRIGSGVVVADATGRVAHVAG